MLYTFGLVRPGLGLMLLCMDDDVFDSENMCVLRFSRRLYKGIFVFICLHYGREKMPSLLSAKTVTDIVG